MLNPRFQGALNHPEAEPGSDREALGGSDNVQEKAGLPPKRSVSVQKPETYGLKESREWKTGGVG